MKKLVLALAIVFGTVGVIRFVQLVRAERIDDVLNHVISCDEFYEIALPNVDDTTIVNVFKAIKNNPDAYVCVQLPYGYMALPKDPFKVDGGEFVSVVNKESVGMEKGMDGMFKRNGVHFWFAIHSDGSVEKKSASLHDYYDVFRMYKAIVESRLVYGSLAK